MAEQDEALPATPQFNVAEREPTSAGSPLTSTANTHTHTHNTHSCIYIHAYTQINK